MLVMTGLISIRRYLFGALPVMTDIVIEMIDVPQHMLLSQIGSCGVLSTPPVSPTPSPRSPLAKSPRSLRHIPRLPHPESPVFPRQKSAVSQPHPPSPPPRVPGLPSPKVRGLLAASPRLEEGGGECGVSPWKGAVPCPYPDQHIIPGEWQVSPGGKD